MSEIMKEIQEGRERWPKGIDTVDNTTTIKDIDEYGSLNMLPQRPHPYSS
jgi:hypothetical protein